MFANNVLLGFVLTSVKINKKSSSIHLYWARDLTTAIREKVPEKPDAKHDGLHYTRLLFIYTS